MRQQVDPAASVRILLYVDSITLPRLLFPPGVMPQELNPSARDSIQNRVQYRRRQAKTECNTAEAVLKQSGILQELFIYKELVPRNKKSPGYRLA